MDTTQSFQIIHACHVLFDAFDPCDGDAVVIARTFGQAITHIRRNPSCDLWLLDHDLGDVRGNVEACYESHMESNHG